MKQQIEKLIQTANLKRRQITFTETHGRNKNETFVTTQYYDPLHNHWTTWQEAMRGHIYQTLNPIINEILRH